MSGIGTGLQIGAVIAGFSAPCAIGVAAKPLGVNRDVIGGASAFAGFGLLLGGAAALHTGRLSAVAGGATSLAGVGVLSGTLPAMWLATPR